MPYVISFVPLPVAYMNYFSVGTYVSFYNYSLNGTSYLWDFGDGTTSTLENPTHTYPGPGTYFVTFTVTNQCGTDVVTMWIGIKSEVGIEEISSIEDLQIYPIPSNELLTISFETQGSTEMGISVVNTLGQEIYNEVLGSIKGKYQKVLNVQNYPAGVYYLQLKADEGIAIRKFVVN